MDSSMRQWDIDSLYGRFRQYVKGQQDKLDRIVAALPANYANSFVAPTLTKEEFTSMWQEVSEDPILLAYWAHLLRLPLTQIGDTESPGTSQVAA